MTVKTAVSRPNILSVPSYQNIFFRLMSQMTLGKLELTLPSGESRTFGSSQIVPSHEVARIRLKSERFFKRCILFGDIGFGESYAEGEWETDSIAKVVRWMILNWENNPGVSGSKVSSLGIGVLKLFNRIQHVFRDNDLAGSEKNIAAHYDLGNSFFETFLDPTLTYSCADFSQGTKSLEEAQIAKFDRLARAALIRQGDHVLEIGSGWGAFAVHLAKNYKARVTTITVSKEQFNKVQERIREEQLTDQIEVKFLDYRKIEGRFDRIVSVEMIEAVGHQHLRSFFEVAERVLKPKGMMGLQVITSADSRYEKLRHGVDWIQKHIFPGSLIPSVGALSEAAIRSSKLQIFSLHDMGSNYPITLKAWHEKFNSNLERVRSLGFDDRFIRNWNYYLGYCEAAFIERHISVVQIVYTRPNNTDIQAVTRAEV